MRRAPLFVAAYDIADDGERRRVDRVLSTVGFRAQKSVFEARLTRADRTRLQRLLGALAIKTGWVKFYAISGTPWTIGDAPEDPDAGLIYCV